MPDGFIEAKSNTCRFDDINGVVLEKVCEYFYYNEKNKDEKDVPDMDFPTELCLELLMAADYLDGEALDFLWFCFRKGRLVLLTGLQCEIVETQVLYGG